MDRILILDFGSQYTQLICRRVRELGVYAEIVSFNVAPSEILSRGARGLILSGGPASVSDHRAPKPDPGIFRLGVPILGICYGMQVTAQLLGGRIGSELREYGPSRFVRSRRSPLFDGLPASFPVWMSHGDSVRRLPAGFAALGDTSSGAVAAMADESRQIYGVQFHPEVEHTPLGKNILANFLFKICGCRRSWTMKNFIEEQSALIRQQVGRERVLCAVSGGVDSTVMAVLLYRVLGRRLIAVFVDTGLLRLGEAEAVPRMLKKFLPVRVFDARRQFLSSLEGVVAPERKRRIIGREFIRVF
ncbi:MAG: glutamine-hydrolyzing GMP synthase, partial [candidate division WOR-3 bacterium]